MHSSGRQGNRLTFSCSVSAGLVLLDSNSVNLFCAHRDMDLEGVNAHTRVQTVWHNNAQHRLVTSAYNLVLKRRVQKLTLQNVLAGTWTWRA